MKKILKNSLLVLVLCLILTGCKEDVDIVNTSNKKGKTSDNVYENINVKGNGKLECTRQGNGYYDLDVEFHYYITYEKGSVLVLHSIEKVSGDSQSGLDEYEEAYKKIKKTYDGIKYYDMSVIRDKNSVTSDMNINYAKVDIDKLIEIEGSDLFVNKKLNLKKWLEFGKKAGLTCKGVHE